MYQRISIDLLDPNTGQIKGLPKNPRQWTDEDVADLAKSLRETPELYEARPLLVFPRGDRFVVLGGNMRLAAAKLNGDDDAPCWVYDKKTPAAKLKEIVAKDNSSFGSWDTAAWAQDWAWVPKDWHLPDFGVVEAPEGASEPRAGSRAAGDDDVDGTFAYAIRVEFNDVEAQLALFEELEGRGYKVSVV